MDKNFISAERLKSLTDGLIAIVMTLLVLEIKIPLLATTSFSILNIKSVDFISITFIASER
ncbi:TMEM175 family protein [Legionella gresilensis]|uniref:TMEM175 family protein n=1 Tax=Legionella gresilensis TaxID=91823 RepID=UPI001A9479F5|nr:TMEM175 family protein [Legionella gresilensis]